MPIQVICPGCHARFKVSDKFAGQRGPCPKCKDVITIPKLEDEVVIHAPEAYGPKGVDGTATLKPIQRQETKASVVVIGGSIAATLVTVAAAFAIGKLYPAHDVPKWLLGLGAVVLAPPLVYLGYTFLRDQELAAYSGQSLWTRIGICSIVYAGLWGMHLYIRHMVVGTGTFELFHLVYVLPLLVVPGALASLATLDLDSISAGLHYGLYLLTTVLLRLLMDLPPI
jgi:hypothetical protein